MPYTLIRLHVIQYDSILLHYEIFLEIQTFNQYMVPKATMPN